MTTESKLIEKQKELIDLLKRWCDTDPESNHSKKVKKCESEIAALEKERQCQAEEQETDITQNPFYMMGWEDGCYYERNANSIEKEMEIVQNKSLTADNYCHCIYPECCPICGKEFAPEEVHIINNGIEHKKDKN